MAKAFVLELEGKDAVILKGLEALQKMEQRISSMIEVHTLTEKVLAEMVFDGKKEDAKHIIQLDEHHRIVLEMKEGEFSWDQECDHPECGDDEVGEAEPSAIDQLASIIFNQRD